MKIVITGATGNLGTALVRHLLAAGGHDLLGLARRLPDPDQWADGTGADRLHWASLDLTHDGCRSTLRWAFRDADAVVHLAWGFQPTHDPAHLEELGVGGSRRVLEAARAEGVPHLVHMSSVGAYSPKTDDQPVPETYPTHGIPGSVYSRHKAAAERLLDDHDAALASGGVASPRVTRLRPGIVGQRGAGSALLRYGVPGLVPGRAVTWAPVVPLDRRLVLPIVHADDVADAIARVLSQRAYGAFNLAAPVPVTAHQIAAALQARLVHVPAGVLRVAVDGSWRARLQPLDPGWLDLGMQVPLMDTARAQDELGWSAGHDAHSVLRETVAGLHDSAASPTPVLRPRTVPSQILDRLRRGPVSSRHRP